MAKNLALVSLHKAVERARKHPSQIADMEAVANGVMAEFGTADFTVKAELHSLLADVTSDEKKREVIYNYLRGLRSAAEEARIETEELWQYFFNGEQVENVLFDKDRNQLIVSTEPRDKVKTAAVYAIDLERGRKKWMFPMKRAQSAFTMSLNGSELYFTIQSHSENEDIHIQRPVYALNLENGQLLWKWLPENTDYEDVGRIAGLAGKLVLAAGDWNLFALDTETQKERWRVVGSLRAVFDDGFLVSKNKELVWLDKNGLPKKKLKLEFPRKNEGSISELLVDGDNVYVAVSGSWHVYKKGCDSESTVHSHTVFYAVDKCSAKVKWSFTPNVKEMRCGKIISSGNYLYFCGIDNTVVLKQSTGKLVRHLPYLVLHVSGNMFFHTDAKNQFADDGFIFYARDAETEVVKWQRKNFNLITAKNNLLFGRVGSSLVIIDAATGKERASVTHAGEPRWVNFVDDNTFWFVAYNRYHAKSVVVLRMSDVE